MAWFGNFAASRNQPENTARIVQTVSHSDAKQRKEDRNILFDQAAEGRRKPDPGIWFIAFSVDFSLEPTLASVAEIWWQSHHFYSEVGYADDGLKSEPGLSVDFL
jgi:hypothetical protein